MSPYDQVAYLGGMIRGFCSLDNRQQGEFYV